MIRVTMSHRAERVLGLDTESRPSAFWYGEKTTAEITAFAWKWEHEPNVRTLLLLANGRFQPDTGKPITARKAYTVFAEVLAQADVVYAHNLRQHDLPLIQAGMFRNGLPPLPELRTTDTLRDIPKRKDMSASLENLAKTLGLDSSKFHLSVADWETANRLAPDGVAIARARVASDVLLQEALRAKLLEIGILRPPRTWRP